MQKANVQKTSKRPKIKKKLKRMEPLVQQNFKFLALFFIKLVHLFLQSLSFGFSEIF